MFSSWSHKMVVWKLISLEMLSVVNCLRCKGKITEVLLDNPYHPQYELFIPRSIESSGKILVFGMGNFTQEGFKYCAPGNYAQWNTDKLFCFSWTRWQEAIEEIPGWKISLTFKHKRHQILGESRRCNFIKPWICLVLCP